MNERQYLQEAIQEDLALVKKIEARLSCEDDPRRQLKLKTDCEEIWQHIRQREARLSALGFSPCWQALLSIAQPTDRIRLEVAESENRDLGAKPKYRDVTQDCRLGSQYCVSIQSDRVGHLLLLDRGSSGKIYCLCPSWFAPATRIEPGLTYLPRRGSPYPSFVATGQAGAEELLAIITDEGLGLDWMSDNLEEPARLLDVTDLQQLLNKLDERKNSYTVLVRNFNIVAY